MTQPYAAGAILSTVEDLFKWNQGILSGKLLRKESLDKAFTAYKLTDGTTTEYGYGWRLGNLYESETIWHGGLINGFITMSMYLPQEDVFVVVFSNCNDNSPVEVTSKLAALTIGKSFNYKSIPVKAEELQEYPGVYENEKGQLRILSVSENGLYSQIGRGPKSLLKAYHKDRFFFTDDSTTTVSFKRNSNGKVEKLIIETLHGNKVWSRTSKPIPTSDGIKLEENILEGYVGRYEVSPQFSFTITRQGNRLFLQATGQEKIELFAETESKFFLKVNDAELDFIKNDSGMVFKVIVNQGGRRTDAMRAK
jgi:hypothetical protein